MVRLFFAGFVFLLSSLPALAHAGHVGELAGHAHWLGLGAMIAAGAIAAAIAKKRAAEKKSDEKTEEGSLDEGEAA